MWRLLFFALFITLSFQRSAQAQNTRIPTTNIPTVSQPSQPTLSIPATQPILSFPSTQQTQPVLSVPSTQPTQTILRNQQTPYPNEIPTSRVSDRIPNPNSGVGLDPSLILSLIQSLSRSATSPQPNIDSCDLSDVRSSVSRLYLILANQYLIQNQLTSACSALDSAYITQLEGYVCRGLPLPSVPTANDCHAGELQNISQLTGSRTALIYPVVFSDRLEILLVPPASNSLRADSGTKQFKLAQANPLTQPIHRVVYDASPDNVKRTIRNFRDSLVDKSLDDSHLPAAQQLYNWIIRPIEQDLAAAQIETLVFVMDGDLRVVPTSAFHDGQRYLVEKYASVSVAAMPVTNVEKRDRSSNLQILAMGLSDSVQGSTPLPAAKIEVETIVAQVLKGNAFLNQDFTIGNLQNQYGKQPYSIVHLATHAQFINQKFGDSYIQFWNDRLRLNQIPDLKLGSDMLTLSACQTAVGENLGISGVAVRSGAKSVLASLWSVSDLGTTPLMLSFYSNFQSAPSKAIALRKAQLSLLQGQVKIVNNQIQGIKGVTNANLKSDRSGTINLSHPFFWSAFILVGNWL